MRTLRIVVFVSVIGLVCTPFLFTRSHAERSRGFKGKPPQPLSTNESVIAPGPVGADSLAVSAPATDVGQNGLAERILRAKLAFSTAPRAGTESAGSAQKGISPAALALNMASNAAFSTAVMTTSGGRNTQNADVLLLGDLDGREDLVSDHAGQVDNFAGLLPDFDMTLTRTAISEHTVANGFNENVFYYGDSAGNLWVGTDTTLTSPTIESLRQIHIPSLINIGTSGGVTLLNPTAGDCADDQVTVTGIAVNPVADLSDFTGVACGTIGEVVYVSIMDTSGCASSGAGQPFRTRIIAFAFTDGAGANAATPAGAIQILRNPLGNSGGLAVDDSGSLYFHLVDLTTFVGGAIFKVTEGPRNVAACAAGNPRINRVIPSVPSGLSGGIGLNSAQGTPAAPIIVSAGMRLTNYSGPSTIFGNIVAIATGPANAVYAAVARSLGSGDNNASGLFPVPTALSATGMPSMIISFADTSGASDTCTSPAPGFGGSLPTANGIADVAQAGLTLAAGVNNFRVFAYGTGPDPRTSSPNSVKGSTADTQKLDFQIDYSIYSGLTVDEAGKLYLVSGGSPIKVGANPSPTLGEVLLFEDCCPADRRGDFTDLRGVAQLPDPPSNGGNAGDGLDTRADHLFWKAPNDAITGTPVGIAGLSRGFLRYLNRTAPNTITNLPNGVVQGDDSTNGPISFNAFDPSGQVAGGDDAFAGSTGDDSNGGFELAFGRGPGAPTCPNPWLQFFLNSNGSVSFGAGDTANTPTVPDFFTGPARIAGAWTDLNPNSRASSLTTFPVQAVGFAGINQFKVRYIDVPEFGADVCTASSITGQASNTFSISLFDDGTAVDESLPASAEGPTDARFTPVSATGLPTTVVSSPLRREGSGNFVFDYGRMDLLGTALQPVITGYSIGGLAGTVPPGLCEANLGESARSAETSAFGVLQGQEGRISSCLVGEGTEPSIYEFFNEGTVAGLGTGGQVLLATPDFDLRFEGNDPGLSTPPRQRDLNKGRVGLFGVSCAAPIGPVISQIIPGPFVVAPNQPANLINALGPVDIFVVGTGFFPNEVTTVCQGDGSQRAGKTVSTTLVLTVDSSDADNIPDTPITLTNVTPINANMVRGTLLPAALPGTAFPLAATGPNASLALTTSFTAGDNNIFGAFTRTATQATSVGGRAPVVLTATPTSGDCGSAQALAISGASFNRGDGTTNVTSVFAIDPTNPGVSIPATSFLVTDTNNLNATFNFPGGSAGKTFLIFASGPNGTSRNMITLPAGTPVGVPTGNEAGNIVSFSCGQNFQFSGGVFGILEDCVVASVTITRGSPSGTATVDVATSDGSALQKSDYTAIFRTISFGVGETSKTVNIPITEDSFNEPTEFLNLLLSNPTGGAVLGGQSTAILNILNDDDPPPPGNAIDDPATFVCQHYHDFLNRQGDAAGLAFWTDQITSCAGDPACIEVKRINVSAAFFLSIEFQNTGFFVLRTQRAAFGKKSADPLTRFAYLPFLKDTQQVGTGVVFGQPGADALLEANKQAYTTQIVTSAPFIAAYPLAQAGPVYVDALFATATVVPTAAERTAAITAFGGGGTAGRVAALRSVVDAISLRDAEFNPAFVLMQYYGYLRRNPTDPPDNNDVGYQFWLTKLNSFGGNFVNAEMVKAFIRSAEYRQRFGP